MNKRLLIGLSGMFAALAIFMLYLAWPLMTGTDVVLHTQPVDPFDPFRGQYITIRYDVSTVPKIENITQGDIVYVTLEKQSNDLWNYTSLSLTAPNSGVFLKGIVDRTNTYDNTMVIQYGIEQYFFERGATFNTTNMTVHAKIASNGNARILELLHDGKPVKMEYR